MEEKDLNEDELMDDDEKVLDPDLIAGDDDVIDTEEIDPFNDKWEE